MMSKPDIKLTYRDNTGHKQEITVVSRPVVRHLYVWAETDEGRVKIDVRDVIGWEDDGGNVHVPGW